MRYGFRGRGGVAVDVGSVRIQQNGAKQSRHGCVLHVCVRVGVCVYGCVCVFVCVCVCVVVSVCVCLHDVHM